MSFGNWETGEITILLGALIILFAQCLILRNRMCQMHLAILSCFCWNNGFLSNIGIIPFLFILFYGFCYLSSVWGLCCAGAEPP